MLFDAVYDATEVLTTKNEMPVLPVSEIKKDDLVLVETKITRYHTKDADNKWSLQRVQMELLAISLLHSAEFSCISKPTMTHDIAGLRI